MVAEGFSPGLYYLYYLVSFQVLDMFPRSLGTICMFLFFSGTPQRPSVWMFGAVSVCYFYGGTIHRLQRQFKHSIFSITLDAKDISLWPLSLSQ